jgi:hypothetical protein
MSTATTTTDRRPPEDPSAVTVRLLDESMAADLALLRSQVAAGVAQGRGVMLDVSAVEKMSSPTVAAILWARRSCAARNLPFIVTGHRSHNHRLLRSCGLVDAARKADS